MSAACDTCNFGVDLSNVLVGALDTDVESAQAAAEAKLGDVSPQRVKAIKAAMARARKADIAGNQSACEKALADAQRALGP